MGGMNKGLFTSKTVEWETPQSLFDELDEEFGFTLDPCATRKNAKCKRYFTPKKDGLKQEWTGMVFMNPPYGRVIGDWIKKAYEAARGGGATVVCLIPSRTDTRWWHEYVVKATEIRFIRGRLKFGGGKNSAPFPSAIAIFKPNGER